jgi:opacity protein-like surface antigen
MNTTRLGVLLVLLGSAAGWAEVPLSFYGDTDFVFRKEGDTSNSFAVPRLELFATHHVDRVSFLTEVMLEVNEHNEFSPDVERVEVGFQVTDWLRVRAGRFHTALGYYNDAVHHGAYFMVPVTRASIVDFEDGGGLIPAHSVGLHADGRFELGRAARLRFDVDLSNGRQASLTEIGNLFDVNKGKSVNLRLRLEPLGALEGLVFGVNAMIDRLTLTGDSGAQWGTEQILGAHLAYFEHSLHLIAEGYAFHHTLDQGRFDGWTLAGLLELGYVLDDFTPYARVEVAHFPAGGDVLFTADAATGDRLGVAAGVKYTFSDNVALKLQGEWFHHGAAGLPERFTGTAQCAFAF